MSKTKTLTLGLLLVGALLGVSVAVAPVAAAESCEYYVNVPTQGWTCVPPDFQRCIGYVHDPIYDEWRCIPDPR